MSLKVTAEMLKKAGACPTQMRRFKREWPDGVRLSCKAFLRAMELGLSVWWFLDLVLRRGALYTYNAVRKRAERRRDEALEWSCVRCMKQTDPGKQREALRAEGKADKRAQKRFDRTLAFAAARACKTGLRKRLLAGLDQ